MTYAIQRSYSTPIVHFELFEKWHVLKKIEQKSIHRQYGNVNVNVASFNTKAFMKH